MNEKLVQLGPSCDVLSESLHLGETETACKIAGSMKKELGEFYREIDTFIETMMSLPYSPGNTFPEVDKFLSRNRTEIRAAREKLLNSNYQESFLRLVAGRLFDKAKRKIALLDRSEDSSRAYFQKRYYQQRLTAIMNALLMDIKSESYGIESDKTVLTLGKIPEQLSEDFGRGWAIGTIRIKNITAGILFDEMEGGSVEIDECHWQGQQNEIMIGGNMRSESKLRINNAEGCIGWRSDYSTISVDNFARGKFCSEAHDITAYIGKVDMNAYESSEETIKPMIFDEAVGIRETLFIQSYEGGFPEIDFLFDDNRWEGEYSDSSIVLFKIGRRSEIPAEYTDLYYFEEKTGEFGYIPRKAKKLKKEPRKVKAAELEKLFKLSDDDGFYYSIDTQSTPIDYENMWRGILILEKVEKPGIGKGMSGGIIVIDDQRLSLDQASALVHKDRKGGLIFYLKRWREWKNGLPVRKSEFIEIY